MKTITTIAEIQTAIREQEKLQAAEWLLLREQFLATYESLKPVNLIKNTLKDVISSPGIKTNLVNSVIGMAGGLAAKKLVLGKSTNFFSGILGAILESVVSSQVEKHADGIKSLGSLLIRKITGPSHSNQPHDGELL